MVHDISAMLTNVILAFVICPFFVDVSGETENDERSKLYPWTWECNTDSEMCEKVKWSEDSSVPQMSFETCRIACGSLGRLWPAPTGLVNISTLVARVSPSQFSHTTLDAPPDVSKMISVAFEDFRKRVRLLAQGKRIDEDYVGIDVEFLVRNESLLQTYATDESYKLSVWTRHQNNLGVQIVAGTYFGARHGLESLMQLIAYEKFCECFTMVSNAQIEDAPMYKHRGVSLDTSRNFFPISDLKRIVDGLAMNKLNVFHWHMTDTHSFPFNVTKWPQMASDGAYSSDMVYQPADVKDFVEYARMRGVKVIPELDAPAHCGNGWTWGNELGLGDLVWCANEDPWYDLCVEPPCGQLNPLNENVFQILRDIYAEWSTLFDTDLIHLGGDELSKKCWEREPSVQSWIAKNASAVEESKRIVYFWWEAFQKRAENLLETAFGKNHDVILWTSALTKDGIEFLDKDKHVIQIWTESNNKEIGNLLRLGFRLIMSNVDALYLDCGFQAWVGDGHNWCSPYKTWQQIYDNDPRDIMKQHAPEMSDEAIERLSLGAEGALWTEQVDVASVDSRLFPRLVALAERLWTRPKNARTDKVLWRLQAQRSRMMYLGVNSDALLPEWCMQNEGRCTRLPQDRKLEIDDGGL